MNGKTAASERATLTMSIRPAIGSLYSGKKNGPVASSNSITGTPNKKSEPHQKCSRSAPPITGPIAAPTMKQLVQAAMAVARSPGSRNIVLMRASVDGINVAPVRPISARAPINIATLVE